MAAANDPVLDRPVPERATNGEFVKALETQISASWDNVELRTILHRLADTHKTAVLLDRGIDPNRNLDLDLGYQRLLAGFAKVAKEASANLSVLGNTIYVGPPARIAKLRTLELLRREELSSKRDRLGNGRILALSQKRTVHWNDLDEPRQIIEELAEAAGIAIVNPEAISHDLWAGATLPDATLTQALSLILIQFDLTFAWNEDATQIRLIPVPEKVAVERVYTPADGPSPRAPRAARERFLENAARAWKQQYPGLTAQVDLAENRVLLSGTLEQHEALSGEGPITQKANSPAGKSPPLEKRAFTLLIERVRVIDLMKKLEESDVEFRYDKDLFAARRIDLEQTIDMDVKKADADEFFRAMFDPLGVKFSFKGHSVTLEPK